jgi:hypothetical protein
MQNGFEFGPWYHDVFDGLGIHANCILDNCCGELGVAVGHDEYITGALSPAFSESQNYWLKQIEYSLNAGVDGVDLRIANHNRSLNWNDYGFEEPVMKDFESTTGRSWTDTPENHNIRRKIIADYYTKFYKKASILIRTKGKKVQLHIGPQYVLAKADNRYMGLDWQWERWLCEDLADEITLKGCWPDDKFISKIYKLTKDKNINLHCCPYLNYLAEDGNLGEPLRAAISQALKSDMLNGFIFYEAAYLYNIDNSGLFYWSEPFF